MKSILVSKILFSGRVISQLLIGILVLGIGIIFETNDAEARLYIDITSPSMRRISIAVPDFKCLGHKNKHPELGSKLAGIISDDFDLSGYFRPLDKGSFMKGLGLGLPVTA